MSASETPGPGADPARPPDGAASPPGARRRGRPRAADRDTAILDATQQLLEELGYDRLRIQDVADRAHAGLATIYRRWPTKQALVIAALQLMAPEVPPETDDPRADLHTLLRYAVADIWGPRSHFLAGILASGRAPAYGQVKTVHWLRWADFVPASDVLLKGPITEDTFK